MVTSFAKIILNVGLLALFLCAMFAASCSSQAPIAKSYPYSEQAKMQAAHHWDLLAADVVAQVGKTQLSATKAIYVSTPKGEMTAFQEAYQNLLITQLVKGGYHVVNEERGSMKMTYDVQVVQQESSRFVRPCRGTILIPVAVGVYIIKNASDFAKQWCTWAIGGALAAEELIGREGFRPTDFELIVTTSLMDGNAYVTRHTEIFYINDPAWIPSLQNNYVALGKTMEVVSQ